jgi:hypothetical protein
MKEHFGGEREFTTWLASNVGKPHLTNLLDKCLGEIGEFEFAAEPESRTGENKKVDLVLTSEGNNITIECQDATGILDAVHAGKSQYYAYAKDAAYNIILCEYSSEEMRDYIRYENRHPDKINFLVEMQLRTYGKDELDIIWSVVVRGIEPQLKKTCRANSNNGAYIRTRNNLERNVGVVFAGEDFPMTVECKGKGVTGLLYEDNSVVVGSQRFDNVSAAARSVMNVPAINGWSSWMYNGKSLHDWRADNGFGRIKGL